MTVRHVLAAAAVLAALAVPAVSQLKLTERNPDEPAEWTYRNRFTLTEALNATRRIDRSLQSFHKVTDLARGKVPEGRLKAAGNTDAETQDLGFANWVGVVEGTLRKQAYEMARVRLELAQLKAKDGKSSASDVAARQKELKAAETAFQRFWDRFGVAD